MATVPSDAPQTNGMSSAVDHAEKAEQPHKKWDYGGNPLAREQTSESLRLQAFGGELQPGLFRVPKSNLGNPAPLGLSAFALTTFVLSLINLGVQGQSLPSIVVALAYGYGGLVQLLAGMWELAAGNTFGATALGSFGGFWISFGIIFTPGGFEIESSYAAEDFAKVFSFYLFGWFIFTFVLLLATLRSTVAFFFLFFTLDLAFLCLALGWYFAVEGAANHNLTVAGGVFGILAAFAAWYNALAGILEPSNSFFLVPVAHFPWSEKGREARGKPTVENPQNVQ